MGAIWRTDDAVDRLLERMAEEKSAMRAAMKAFSPATCRALRQRAAREALQAMNPPFVLRSPRLLRRRARHWWDGEFSTRLTSPGRDWAAGPLRRGGVQRDG
eukprot:7982548-Pyramimonas_sp.AAC.1